MIYFNVPSLYSGLHSMESVLDISKQYHHELRRWEVKDEDKRILIDIQTKETLEIPRFHFALFVGGTPYVVPYDLISVVAMPSPNLIVPDLADINAQEEFLKEFYYLSARRKSSRIILEGVNKDQAYLEYSSTYDLSFPVQQSREEDTVEADSRIKLEKGDTLFTYTYPRDPDYRADYTVGDVEYMPTSRTTKLTEVPAVDSLDLSTPIHRRDWNQIWPKKK